MPPELPTLPLITTEMEMYLELLVDLNSTDAVN